MDAWDRMQSWELVLPPSRPSHDHLTWFRRQLSHLPPEAPVAVLGSTAELRDLLNLQGFRNVYVLERNLSFLGKMDRLRTTQSDETLLKGDWIQTLGNSKGRFAAILSDLTSGNVPYSDQQEFYFRIARSLQPDGIFCDKILSHPIPHERLDDLLAKYETAPFNLDTLNRFNCEVFFCSELLSRFGKVDCDGFYAHLNSKQLGPTNRMLLARLPLITPPGMTWYYGEPWTRMRDVVTRHLYLSTEQLERGSSPYANRLRLVRWNRKEVQ